MKEYADNVPTWVWLTSLLLPPVSSVIALVKWVEQGSAPDALAAVAGPKSPWPGRERPLCAYPAVARYNGSGDVEKAASFSCRL